MTVNYVTVKGLVAPRFEAVRDAFSEIFGAHRAGRGPHSASMSAGQKEADLWGGLADPAAARAALVLVS